MAACIFITAVSLARGALGGCIGGCSSLDFWSCPWLVYSRIVSVFSSTVQDDQGAMQDIDKVLDAAASCKDLDLMMQGLQVASKLIACNGGWLERQRDVTWAALWRGLATIDHRHFDQQHILSMQGSAVGSNECVLCRQLLQSLLVCFSNSFDRWCPMCSS